ncbi:MAG: endonuclease/exonuclease/phosphatase family protein [Acidimicrobiia bacterium]
MQSERLRRVVGVLVVSLVIVAAACDSDDGTSGDSSSTDGASSDATPFRAATFNAGLALNFVDFAEERAPVVAEELGELDTDLLVVQEVWEPEHVAMVEEAAAERYPNQIFLDPQPGEGYAYGGTFGIGILTDQEIVDEDTLVMDSSLNRRAVIYAELETDQIGTVHVFATHLSAIFSDIPYPDGGGREAWAQEQADQIETMNAYIDEKVDDDSPVLLMGDFNTGPAGDTFTAEFEENYDALVAGRDYDNAYTDDESATCTFCNDNTLVDAEGEGGVTIDHILVSGFDGTVETQRIFDEPVSVAVDGEDVMMNLSDHYGLLATLTPAG